MRLNFVRPEDIDDSVAGGFEVIRDERAMALPPQRLGTHDGGAFFAREFQESIDAGAELRSHHKIGIAAKRFVAPGAVGGIRQRFATPSKFRKMNIFNADFGERFGQILLAEVRQAARARKSADIRERLNILRREQFEELLDAAVGMADGPKLHVLISD